MNQSFVALLLLASALTLSGCRIAEKTVALPVKMVTAVVPAKNSAGPDPAALQVELQRYADDFNARTSAALDEYVRSAGTPEARREALNWKLSLGSSALAIASGPNPTANLLDFLGLASLTRAFLEERASTVPHAALVPWLETSRILETNAWKMADATLTMDQQRELHAAIEQWRVDNAGASASFFARPQEFAAVIRQSGEKQAKPGSVFSLVGIDPMAGLDPAVREVTRTRLFAERAMYTIQRMPFFVRWQVELLSDQLLRQEQVTNALNAAEQLGRAAESASRTAALLPDRITTERKAILEALEAQEGKLRELSAEVSRTLAAGEKMSTSLHTTLLTFDALMKRFGVGEPSSGPPDTNSPPFNILDYARTAEQVATMAQQLDALIKDASGSLDAPALDRRIAELNALSGRVRADAKAVLNHAFLLTGGLIVLSFACALVYRRATPRPKKGS